MKLSLASVACCAYFYQGSSLPLEEAVRRAAGFGYDAVDAWRLFIRVRRRCSGQSWRVSPCGRRTISGTRLSLSVGRLALVSLVQLAAQSQGHLFVPNFRKRTLVSSDCKA